MAEGHLDLDNTSYADTPNGIFTASGIWFRTTEALLTEYAKPVLEHESLPRLLEQAEVWLRSPQTLTLWVLPLLLVVIPPWAAALAALAVYVGWACLGPSFVHRTVGKGMEMLEKVPLQALYYVIVLSWIATQEHYGALVVGLAGFVLLRWGLVKRATEFIVRPVQARLYDLPVPDQVLRAVIVRAAMKHRVSLPELDRMERTIIDNWSRQR